MAKVKDYAEPVGCCKCGVTVGWAQDEECLKVYCNNCAEEEVEEI